MSDNSGIMELLNGLAGVAALVNGLLLWPIVRALKTTTADHGQRLTAVEQAVTKRPKRKRKAR